MKVLLIEDNKPMRMAGQRSLTKAGYEVVVAIDGEEGLRIAAEVKPDIVFLDLMLPKMSGLEVLRKLQRQPATKDIPVIILSGLSKTNGPRLLKEGAAKYLQKSEALLQENLQLFIHAIVEVTSKIGPA